MMLLIMIMSIGMGMGLGMGMAVNGKRSKIHERFSTFSSSSLTSSSSILSCSALSSSISSTSSSSSSSSNPSSLILSPELIDALELRPIIKSISSFAGTKRGHDIISSILDHDVANTNDKFSLDDIANGNDDDDNNDNNNDYFKMARTIEDVNKNYGPVEEALLVLRHYRSHHSPRDNSHRQNNFNENEKDNDKIPIPIPIPISIPPLYDEGSSPFDETPIDSDFDDFLKKMETISSFSKSSLSKSLFLKGSSSLGARNRHRVLGIDSGIGSDSSSIDNSNSELLTLEDIMQAEQLTRKIVNVHQWAITTNPTTTATTSTTTTPSTPATNPTNIKNITLDNNNNCPIPILSKIGKCPTADLEKLQNLLYLANDAILIVDKDNVVNHGDEYNMNEVSIPIIQNDNKNTNVGDSDSNDHGRYTFQLKSHKFPELAILEEKVRVLKKKVGMMIRDSIQTLRNSSSSSNINNNSNSSCQSNKRNNNNNNNNAKIEGPFSLNNRIVILIPNDYFSKTSSSSSSSSLNSYTTRGTLGKAYRYMEPNNIIPFGDKLILESQLLQEEQDRIIMEMTKVVRKAYKSIRRGWNDLICIDVAFAKASFGLMIAEEGAASSIRRGGGGRDEQPQKSMVVDAMVPIVECEGCMNVDGFIHPLLALRRRRLRFSNGGIDNDAAKVVAGAGRGTAEGIIMPIVVPIDLSLGTKPSLLSNDVGSDDDDITTTNNDNSKKGIHKNCLIISGANGGGKTVAMKAFGVAAIMIRFAIPISTVVELPRNRRRQQKIRSDISSSKSKSTIPRIDFFHEFHALIGDGQGMEGGQSTMTSRLDATSLLLHGLKDRKDNDNDSSNNNNNNNNNRKRQERYALILLDELGGGSDPATGGALGRSILEWLLDEKRDSIDNNDGNNSIMHARTIVTTHSPRIKAFGSDITTGAGCAAVLPRKTVVASTTTITEPTSMIIPGMSMTTSSTSHHQLRYGVSGGSDLLAVASRSSPPLPEFILSRAADLASSSSHRNHHRDKRSSGDNDDDDDVDEDNDNNDDGAWVSLQDLTSSLEDDREELRQTLEDTVRIKRDLEGMGKATIALAKNLRRKTERDERRLEDLLKSLRGEVEGTTTTTTNNNNNNNNNDKGDDDDKDEDKRIWRTYNDLYDIVGTTLSDLHVVKKRSKGREENMLRTFGMGLRMIPHDYNFKGGETIVIIGSGGEREGELATVVVSSSSSSSSGEFGDDDGTVTVIPNAASDPDLNADDGSKMETLTLYREDVALWDDSPVIKDWNPCDNEDWIGGGNGVDDWYNGNRGDSATGRSKQALSDGKDYDFVFSSSTESTSSSSSSSENPPTANWRTVMKDKESRPPSFTSARERKAAKVKNKNGKKKGKKKNKR